MYDCNAVKLNCITMVHKEQRMRHILLTSPTTNVALLDSPFFPRRGVQIEDFPEKSTIPPIYPWGISNFKFN